MLCCGKQSIFEWSGNSVSEIGPVSNLLIICRSNKCLFLAAAVEFSIGLLILSVSFLFPIFGLVGIEMQKCIVAIKPAHLFSRGGMLI